MAAWRMLVVLLQTATSGQRNCDLQVAAQGFWAQVAGLPLLAALQRLPTEQWHLSASLPLQAHCPLPAAQASRAPCLW